MFENAELGHTIDKLTYEREAPLVRSALLEAQRELADSRFSVVVIVGGVGARASPRRSTSCWSGWTRAASRPTP